MVGASSMFTKTSVLLIALVLTDRFLCISPSLLLKALLCTIQIFVRRTYSDPDFKEPAFLGEESFGQGGP